MKNLKLGDIFPTYRSAPAEIGNARGEELIEGAKVRLDALSSAELRSLANARARFASQPSSSDQLRLPHIANMTGQEISAAVARISSMTNTPVASTEAAVIREQRMRNLLASIAELTSAIQQKPKRSV